MPMTPIPPLDRTSASFRADVDSLFLTRIPTFVTEANAMEANISAIAAGGAYALPYVFDTATADADPGAGKLRLDNATQNAATTMRLDLTVGGQDYTSVINTFGDSTSTIKGTIRLVKTTDASKWLLFNVTAVASPTGYRNLSVTLAGGSAASPFANGDAVMLYFQRNGDKGDIGTGYYVKLAEATVSTPVANIDFLNVFTSQYDEVAIVMQNIQTSAADSVNIRVAIAGVAQTGSNYYVGNAEGTANSAQSSFALTLNIIQPAGGAAAKVTLLGVNDTSAKEKGVFALGGYVENLGGTRRPINRAGSFGGVVGALSGVRMFCGGANFTAGTVRVYGIKNS